MSLERALLVISHRFGSLNIPGLLAAKSLSIYMVRNPIPGHAQAFCVSFITSSKRRTNFRNGSMFMKEYGVSRTLKLIGFFPELERKKGLGEAFLSLVLLKGNRYAGWKVDIFCPSSRFLAMAQDMEPFIYPGSKLANFKDPPVEGEDVRLRVPGIGSIETEAIDHIWSLLRVSEVG